MAKQRDHKHLIVVDKKRQKFRVFYRCVQFETTAKIQYHIADFYTLRGALWYADAMSDYLGIDTLVDVKCDGNLSAI